MKTPLLRRSLSVDRQAPACSCIFSGRLDPPDSITPSPVSFGLHRNLGTAEHEIRDQTEAGGGGGKKGRPDSRCISTAWNPNGLMYCSSQSRATGTCARSRKQHFIRVRMRCGDASILFRLPAVTSWADEDFRLFCSPGPASQGQWAEEAAAPSSMPAAAGGRIGGSVVSLCFNTVHHHSTFERVKPQRESGSV